MNLSLSIHDHRCSPHQVQEDREMRIDEIKSFEGRHIKNWSDRERLGQVLFAAAAKGFEIPGLEDIMSCDHEKVEAAKRGSKGDFAYMLFTLDSTPQNGFVEIKNDKGFKLTASWKDGKVWEVRVTNPRLSCIQALSVMDVCNMRLSVDGNYYNDFWEVKEFVLSLFPHRLDETGFFDYHRK